MLASALVLLLAQPPVSACPVADEPGFATTMEHAAQVGGGAMYAETRERRYLDALRGPIGETLQYKRTASIVVAPDGRTILDRYEVTHAGLEKPIVLFLDAYHFDDALKAPKGLMCAVPFGLNPPGPDPMLASDSMFDLAIEQGTAKEFTPISLDADGSAVHGVIFDRFRLMAHAARIAAAGGTPVNVKQPPRALLTLGMVVVAHPLRCGDERAVAPAAIDILAAQGQAPRRDGELATGEALARLLPHVNLPAGSIGAAFAIERPRPSDSIKIAYRESACGAAIELILPMQFTAARPIATPMPPLPAGQPATDRPVRLQALLDFDGAAQRIVYVGGPAALSQPAIAAVRGWTAEPARLNGAPVIAPVTFQVKFGSQ